MATVQSERGVVALFNDFTGPGVPVAGTAEAPIILGPFNVVGQGLAETDSGAIRLDSDGLAGILQLTTTDEDIHAAGLQTATMFDVGLMAPIVAETRVRQAVITTGELWFGFSDVNTDLAIIEGAIFHGNTATLTLTASDGVGFLTSSELTNSALIYAAFNGGTTTGQTVAATNSLGVSIVAGNFNIFRIEIDTNGTARWFVDGVLLKTQVGAVSTTVDLCLSLIIESKTTAVKTADVDYIMVSANRDWTV